MGNECNYFLYSYQALNGVGSGAIIVFEPYRFSSLAEAKKYASFFKVLKHSEFFPILESEVRSQFNVILDEISISGVESFDERSL